MSQIHPKTRAKAPRRRLPPSLTLLNVQVARGQGTERLYRQIREAIRGAIHSGEIADTSPRL